MDSINPPGLVVVDQLSRLWEDFDSRTMNWQSWLERGVRRAISNGKWVVSALNLYECGAETLSGIIQRQKGRTFSAGTLSKWKRVYLNRQKIQDIAKERGLVFEEMGYNDALDLIAKSRPNTKDEVEELPIDEPRKTKKNMNNPAARDKPKDYYDDFNTPPEALVPLLEFLSPFKSKTIWECACGQGSIAKLLKQYGLNVVESDIKTGTDFLKCEKPLGDVIVTGPPYSLKYEFLEKAIQLGVPFAFLVPQETIHGNQMCQLANKYGAPEMVVIAEKVTFRHFTNGRLVILECMWLCRGFVPEKLCWRFSRRSV